LANPGSATAVQYYSHGSSGLGFDDDHILIVSGEIDGATHTMCLMRLAARPVWNRELLHS